MPRTKPVLVKRALYKPGESRSIEEIKQSVKYISVAEAHKVLLADGVDVSVQSIRAWAAKYKLGKKLGEMWLIDRHKWRAFVDGENKTK